MREISREKTTAYEIPEPQEATAAPPRNALWILVLACAGQFLVVLDVSVVNVALPSIRTDLGFAPAGLSWVVNAYTLTFAGLLLLGGRLADLFGRRTAFLTGIGLFTAASLFGGLAQSPGQLIAARALQGVGAAVLAPATMTILSTSFPEGPRRARALGVWMGVGAAGGAAGSLVGGLLTDLLSWRWVLLVNVPVGAVVCVAGVFVLTRSPRTGAHPRIDLPGAVTVTGGLTGVTYGVIQAETHGWGSFQTLVPGCAGLLLLGLFLLIEAKWAAEPLMPLSMFRNRSVATADACALLIGAGFFSIWYFVSLYQQNVLHRDAIEAGVGFLPHTLSIVLASQISSRLAQRFDLRLIVSLGTLLAASGFFWQSFAGVGDNYWQAVAGPGLCAAFGVGMSMTPLASAATTGVHRSQAGLASGMLNTSRQFGGTLGLAVLVTIAASHSESATGTPEEVLTAGYSTAFTVAAGILLVASAAAWLLPKRSH